MNRIELVEMTRFYTRDTNSLVFTDSEIHTFLNQAIDRLKQYKIFRDMPYLIQDDQEVTVIPAHYHYMLALFSASRCYDKDERFYEGTEKRNEFESLLDELIAEVQSGNTKLSDSSGENLVDYTRYRDHVVDVYFKPRGVIEDD